MEEINFIRPQEVFNRDTGESKVRYTSYDGSNKFIPVVDGEDGVPRTLVVTTHAELKAMRDAGKLTPGSLYRITDYQCTTTQANTRSAGHQFDIVLLALSEDKLAEESWAMMHDNIYDVTFADGVTKKCWIYETEDEEDNIVFVDTLIGCGYVDPYNVTINEENKTATVLFGTVDMGTPDLTYNYFQNSNLSAWKVWYCLDNDKSRFAWADDRVIYNVKIKQEQFTQGQWEDAIAVYTGEKYNTNVGTLYKFTIKFSGPSDTEDTSVYITTENLYDLVGTEFDLYMTSSGEYKVSNFEVQVISKYINGRGVIYRLVDEFNNDIKYDFKNIQFKRTITDGQYDANGTETWCYTLNLWYQDMCQDASIVGNTLPNDETYVIGVYDNKFGYATAYDLNFESGNTIAFALGNNVILSLDEGDGYFGINSNIIGNDFYNNTIGTKFNFNIIGNEFYNNIIRNSFRSNIIGNEFFLNKIGNSFYSNSIGNCFGGNTISDDTSYKNYGNNGVELATKDDLNP